MDSSALRSPERVDPVVHNAKLATRAQYQRAHLLLPDAWPALQAAHPELTSDDYYVLSRQLKKKPGWFQYQARRLGCEVCSEPGAWVEVYRKDHVCSGCGTVAAPRDGVGPGLAEEMGWPRLKLQKSTKRLQRAGLLLSELLTQRDRLPTGRYASTNLLRIYVICHVIESAAGIGSGEPSDGSQKEPSPGRHRSGDAPPPLTPRPRPPRRRRSRPPSADHVASETSREGEATPVDGEPDVGGLRGRPAASERLGTSAEQDERQVLDMLCAKWNALRIPERGGTVSRCRPCERSTIRKRLRDVGLEAILLAIAGAAGNSWLQGGRAQTAVGLVFCSADKVREFAEAGRELAAAAARREAEAAAAAAARARELRSLELWSRAPWAPRQAPQDFLEAMKRGDYDAAAQRLDDLTGAPAADVRGLVVAGASASNGPAILAPTVAQGYASVNRAADEAEARGNQPSPTKSRSDALLERRTKQLVEAERLKKEWGET